MMVLFDVFKCLIMGHNELNLILVLSSHPIILDHCLH